MSNSEYREAQQQARDHGLRARQEARLENATYTAAEVKVLTARARQEAAEEIAEAIEACVIDLDQWPGEFYREAAAKAREIGTKEVSA